MKLITMIAIAVLYLTGPIIAENIGYVDLQKVFINYKETEKAREGFEKKQAELRKELEEKQKTLEKAQKDNKKPEGRELKKIAQWNQRAKIWKEFAKKHKIPNKLKRLKYESIPLNVS